MTITSNPYWRTRNLKHLEVRLRVFLAGCGFLLLYLYVIRELGVIG